MKTYKLIIMSFLSGIMLLTSCEDSLDRFPKDSLSPESYFKNEKELNLYANQFYTILPSAADMYGEIADDITQTELNDEVRGTRTIPGKGGGWNFDKLRNINFLLENSKNCSDVKAKEKYDGVAYFFRAYFYFEKVKRFGDVPWYNKTLSSVDPDLYKARDSRQVVMDSILSDVDKAIALLPSAKDVYHVTKWAALALKSRLCLFEGTYRKYHGIADYEKFLNECVSASEELMNDGGYDLNKAGTEPYRMLFASLNANTTEVILARAYDDKLGLTHNANGYSFSPGTGTPGFTKRFVNQYLMKDGSRFTDKSGWEMMQFKDETLNRDPRMGQTMRLKGYKQIGSTTTSSPNLKQSLTGYQYIKYVMDSKYDAYNKSVVDMPIFRLGETLLNYAEAKAELGTITQSDIDKSIKRLRDRVGMPNLDLAYANSHPDPYLLSAATGYPNVSKGANQGVILEIRRERSIELVMEGFRYYDLMRWKEGSALTQPFLGLYFPGPGTYDIDGDGKFDVCLYEGTKPSAFVSIFLKIGEDIVLTEGNKGNIIVHSKINRVFDENKDYLYPIPTDDRILSKGSLTQNPGWNDGISF